MNVETQEMPPMRWLAVGACAVALVAASCTERTAPRAAPGQVPDTVTVPGASFEFGFAMSRRTSSVSTGAFAITRTPITVGQYKECVAGGGCSAPRLDTPACRAPRVPVVEGKTYDASPSANGLPMTCVSTRQAVDYCDWVGGTLPTVEQWVYAARGATVQEFAWGKALPDCAKHQRAVPVTGQGGGCCPRDACDPSAFYAVAQHPDVASPGGLLDVLLTPTELLRGHKGAPVSACDGERSACLVRGLTPGAIDFAAYVSRDLNQDPDVDPATVWGFRCAFEVNP